MLSLSKTPLLTAIFLAFVLAGADDPKPAPTPAPMGEAESLSASFRKASKAILPAVVTVRPVGIRRGPELIISGADRGSPLGFDPFRRPGAPPNRPFPAPTAGPPDPEADSGSGVILDAEKGYVLTNDHVIDGARGVVVVLHDGRERNASRILRDPRSDLAVVVIDPKGLKQAEWGDSESLETGDWVLAVGQPFGLSGTVTTGIVSGKGRAAGLIPYDDLIQTDAAINPGNSGGPLVDLKGRIVGINTALRTVRGGFEGVGLAIPASRARRVANDLAAFGVVKRGYLGVSIGAVDRETAEKLDQPGAVRVTAVSPGSPAEQAGLQVGDVVLQIDGKALRGVGSLQVLVEFAEKGKPLTLKIVKSQGEPRDLAVTLAERVTEHRTPAEPATPEMALLKSLFVDELGVMVVEPNRELARRFDLRDPVLGVIVTEVDPGGPAARAGVEPGTVIFELDRQLIKTTKDLRRFMDNRAGRNSILANVYRRGPAREIRIDTRAADPPHAEPEPKPKPEPEPPGEAPKPLKLPADETESATKAPRLSL